MRHKSIAFIHLKRLGGRWLQWANITVLTGASWRHWNRGSGLTSHPPLTSAGFLIGGLLAAGYCRGGLLTGGLMTAYRPIWVIQQIWVGSIRSVGSRFQNVIIMFRCSLYSSDGGRRRSVWKSVCLWSVRRRSRLRHHAASCSRWEAVRVPRFFVTSSVLHRCWLFTFLIESSHLFNTIKSFLTITFDDFLWLKPNTHRRRRRDETVESRRVGGVYTPVGTRKLGHGRRLRCAFASPNPSAVVANSCTHRRRRRDETKQFRRVGVGGVYLA